MSQGEEVTRALGALARERAAWVSYRPLSGQSPPKTLHTYKGLRNIGDHVALGVLALETPG